MLHPTGPRARLTDRHKADTRSQLNGDQVFGFRAALMLLAEVGCGRCL
jgi:hypothetical protein